MAQHTVTTIWKENMQFETDNPSGHKVLIDTSKDNGGNNSGLAPKAMMLSSLAGCSGLDVVSLLKKMRIIVDDFKMDATGELTEEHPKYYHTVTLNYHFTGTNLDEDKITKAVNLSVEKYCGVMEMFRKFAKINISIHFHKK
ncbi:OsmC family peroxiredoxin [Tenacibaculum sp. E3R01]|uniref:OsmC family protein n=1 Tax=unclassified Tenacibaculum TaxID=2635139 RepID=UPI00089517E3|nr:MULTISPECIES: OsmC family protein [unclassified Tenacibaculum]RBW59799.1 OsmC family peroxiredoxin [Tenacibaculum sp. E3R01]SED91071.1 putative redox protein [Tenacibaculum sp. MAR_2010_89]